jgi:serine/threonine protein kinase
MNLESPAVECAEELTATILAIHNAPTPVDTRRPEGPVAGPMPAVGEVLLQRWRIVAWAGVGTSSVVFRGEHVELPFPVAIKIVNRQHYADRSRIVGHLRNEAMILGRLRHANLPRLWDFHEEGDYPYLITDFFDGATLRQMIRLEGRLEQRRAVRAAVHVAEVLAMIDGAGIVHRDIKPDNVVLCRDGSAKLIDFGLSMAQGEENEAIHAERSEAPRVGTVAYLAPEQARNSTLVDQRADIYALGATIYHAVTGRLPFTGNNAAQVLLRHIEDEPAPPKAIVPNLSEPLSDAILRMMAKKPCDRYGNARQLLDALRQVQESLR